MRQSVVLRFRVPGEQILANAPGGVELKDTLVVSTADGPRVGTVLALSDTRAEYRAERLSPSEFKSWQATKKLEEIALQSAQRLATKQALKMKIVGTEFSFNADRATFFFAAHERIDFRLLIKALARQFQCRIEMKQIGVRDAARHVGALGTCGQKTCCSSFLPKFEAISIKMAKTQNLVVNHEKLAGVCGRLRCCLQYEQSLYVERRRGMPKMNRKMKSPAGEGRVRELNILERQVGLLLSSGELKYFAPEDLEPVHPSGAQTKT